MSVSRIIPIILAVLLWASTSFAAVVCVGPSASGDGSGADWSNVKAISTLTGGNWTRGNTYYLKEGSYGKVTFTTAASGATYIYIKKCGTEDAACTGLAGYSAADHDGQAVFSATGGSGREWTWGITTNYWDIDGITGGYPNWTTGHGIKVTTDNPQATLAIIYPTTPTGIRIQHVEFAHVGRTYNSTSHADAQAIKMYDAAGTNGGGSHYFAYNYFHDNPTGVFWTRLIGSATFEYNYMNKNASGVDDETATSIQGAGMTLYCADDYIIKNNMFKNIEGSRIIALYAGHETGTMCNGNSTIDDVKIYNNVFFWEESLAGDSTSDTDHLPALDGYSMFLQDGYIAGESGVTLTNIKVYSNTFSNLDAYRVIWAAAGTDGNEFKNNIVYNCEGNTTASDNFKGFAHANNWYYGANAYNSSTDLTSDWAAESNSVTGVGSPFTNIATEDFTLAAGATAINAGADLGSTYNKDILGISRPQGAGWDIGAYEYTGGATTYSVTLSTGTGCTTSPSTSPADMAAIEQTLTVINGYGYTCTASGCGGTFAAGALTYTPSAPCTITTTGTAHRATIGSGGTVTLGGSGTATLGN